MAKRNGLKSLFKPKFLIGLFCVVSMIVLWNYMSKNREGLDSGKELVLVHMNNCGHCKKMMPEWKKCKKQNNTGIKIVDYEMNTTKGKDLVKKHNINGFPTILLIENGKKLDTYNGERTSESILEFMKNAD
jgi:thioredoxin-like negative regulator of GroEL